MRWSPDQVARLARLADECAELTPSARAGWAVAASEREADLADAIAAMAAMTDTPDGPALTAGLEAGDDVGQPGDLVGPYRLQRLLGTGGMGAVWLAEQVDGRVQREVALKLLRVDASRRAWRLRFERERDILAHLEHPGIARLIDAGTSEDGRPYLAMAYVSGHDIVSHARTQALGARDCVRLVLELLAAVQHAHGLLVVHRDLKPGNILVDAAGRVVLLDFGIAKLIEPAAPTEAAGPVTALAGAALTLDYASPEQVAGRPVGIASDIYSAGVVLYELLAGQRPYRLQRGSRAEMEEAILAQDIAAPSQRVDPALARLLGEPVRRVARGLRGDLDAIVLKAMAREPAQRYASADALADDLRRWLDGRPVLAQGLGRWYVASRLLRRHRWGVAGVAGVVAALSVGLGTALWQADRARSEARAAQATERFLLELFRTNGIDQDDPAQAQLTTARTLLERGSQRMGGALAEAPETRLRMLDALIRLDTDLGLVDAVDGLEQQRLALWRELHPRDAQGLAERLIAAGHAAALGNTRTADAGRLLDEAEQAMDRAGLPASAPQRGYLALARVEAVDADQCAALKQARLAIALLRPVAEADPRWLDALTAGTRSAAYCGDGDEALMLGREALAYVEHHPVGAHPDIVHQALSLAYLRKGLPAEAIAESREALRQVQARQPPELPPGTEVLIDATFLASKLRDYAHPADALAVSGPLLARVGAKPSDPDAAVGLWIDHGRALRELGRLDEAREALAQAERLLPTYEVEDGQRAMLLDALADVLSAQGRIAEATRGFDDAWRLHEMLHHSGTSQVFPHLARRVAHELRQGRVDAAAELMGRFVMKTPPSGTSTHPYIERQVLLGEVAQARRDWRAVEASATEALARYAVYAEPEYARDLQARALELQAAAWRATGRAAQAVAAQRDAQALRRALAAPSS